MSTVIAVLLACMFVVVVVVAAAAAAAASLSLSLSLFLPASFFPFLFPAKREKRCHGVVLSGYTRL